MVRRCHPIAFVGNKTASPSGRFKRPSAEVRLPGIVS